MDDFLRDLQAHWKSQGIPCSEPASPAELKQFEQEFGVRLPADFASYLVSLNGMDLGHDGAMDGEMISFWRLRDIRLDRLEHPLSQPDLYAFGDWSIDACTYAIQLSADATAPTPIFIACDGPIKVADSFAEFVAAYLRNDERALYAKGT
jgi:SMI1/KNR4 family protein SUKH-1